MKLSYTMTNTKTGEKIQVWDERNDGRSTTHYIGPFDEEVKAKEYATSYEEAWHYGYNGSASVSLIEGKYYARCHRWNSCD